MFFRIILDCTPEQTLQELLSNKVSDERTECHPLFCELDELVYDDNVRLWKETARWIKFEENVEDVGNRWSKPHVATLSLHSLFQLRSLIFKGHVELDIQATSTEQIVDLLLDNLITTSILKLEERNKVKEILLKKHVHQQHREPVWAIKQPLCGKKSSNSKYIKEI